VTRLARDLAREVSAEVGSVPAPASAAEALAVIRAGMGYLAAADPTAMAAAAQAECLQTLEQLDAVQTAARVLRGSQKPSPRVPSDCRSGSRCCRR
jgi:hypothetical protein